MIRKVRKSHRGKIELDSDMFGERKRLSTGEDYTKKTAKRYELHFDVEFRKLYERRFGFAKSESFTFEQYGAEIMEITSADRSPETQKSVMRQFKNLCKTFGKMDVSEIKSFHILKWQHSCGFAPKTVRGYRSILNIILQTAYNDEIINRNPLHATKPPKAKPVRKSIYYYAEDIRRIIDAAQGELRDKIITLLFTGLRGGELIALEWSDIDFNNRVIHVRRSVRDGREKETKTGIMRDVPMFTPTFEALKRQQKRTGLTKKVFLNQFGVPYRNQDGIRRAFKALCVEAGVEVGSLHDLRRSCNTLLKQRGVQDDAVLDMIGNIKDVNRQHYTGKIDVDLSVFDSFLA